MMNVSNSMILMWELAESNSWCTTWQLKEKSLGIIARVYSYSKKYCERNKHPHPLVIFGNIIKARSLLPWKKIVYFIDADALMNKCTEGQSLDFRFTFVPNDEIKIETHDDNSVSFEW